jgi:hypothetical protein
MPPARDTTPVRVAMWSGPRNISTALMRSWSSRPDTAVTDEPLYAHYLSTLAPGARAAHPAAEEVMAAQPTDWRTVADTLTGPVPRGPDGARSVWYQKHMAHHLTPGMMGDLGWIHGLTNVFLIRDPAEMLTSFIKVIDRPTREDLGLPQQVRLFDRLHARLGAPPPVFDARDILRDPETGLAALCDAVGVPFDPAMLSWPEGPHPDDGVWAPHWYASVHASTGFGAYRPKNEPVPGHLTGVLSECQRLYDHLAQFRTMG